MNDPELADYHRRQQIRQWWTLYIQVIRGAPEAVQAEFRRLARSMEEQFIIRSGSPMIRDGAEDLAAEAFSLMPSIYPKSGG